MDWVWIILIGFAGGLAGGMLGIGGSTVMIPCLTLLFGPRHQHLHQAVGMIVTFFVVSAAVIEHRRARAIMAPVVWAMLPWAAVCVILGVWASEWSVFRGGGQVYLASVFGVLLAYIVVDDLLKLVKGDALRERTDAFLQAQDRGDKPRRSLFGDAANRWRAWLIGVAAGFLGGLTGVGGGFIAVPLQRKLLGLPLRNAIANSAACIVALSVIGAAYKNYALVHAHGYPLTVPLRLALMLIPTAVMGSLIGSRLTHILPVRVVHAVFIAFLAVAAVRLMVFPWQE